ncbi:MAG: TetR/AcrR family transcriptional regulator [Edaphobacter sp.]|uniref:TetR/AcrR family transcriptional regulator n=1 Tax=Edaphobacter sp. TaxID=1934404 RepID=UPI00238DAC03|nr:TetR/AcrR family transcriptional regulator [Edaphobacter sp.]MDE1176354.1 TetR/AcrR family transcriptional regulator [Edaphobacter sp.]
MKTDGTARSKARDISSWSPSDQARRDAILRAASAHVRHYGYQKTTVADIAKTIHLSTAYLYNFFDSKQAIGEAVCTRILSDLMSELDQSVRQITSPSECIVFIFQYLAEVSIKMFRDDRKIHDLVARSFHEHWTSPTAYNAELLSILKSVILRGRETGEFERKTPLDETCEAVRYTTETFFHPVLLEQNPRNLIDEALMVALLVRRSLLC